MDFPLSSSSLCLVSLGQLPWLCCGTADHKPPAFSALWKTVLLGPLPLQHVWLSIDLWGLLTSRLLLLSSPPLLLVFFGVAQVKCEMEATKLALSWCLCDVCRHVKRCACLAQRSEEDLKHPPPLYHSMPCYFEKGSPAQSGACGVFFFFLSMLASSCLCCLQFCCCRHTRDHAQVSCRCWDLNSGPHVCAASAFTS